MSDPFNTLLLVDDEPNILSALRRVFRKEGYEVVTAQSAADGFARLEERPIGVVVSDHRMPEMTGVQFLKEVRRRWPQTVRAILSGYAEPESIVSAVNEAGIAKFLTKPWGDDDLRGTVKECFAAYRLGAESHRLSRDLAERNNDLATLNLRLESAVRELKEKQEEIERAVTAMTETLASLQETADPFFRGHAEKVRGLALAMARALNLPAEDCWTIATAALLMDLGSVGIDPALRRSQRVLSDDDKAQIRRHPEIGAGVLSLIPRFTGVARTVRHHHEHYDGSGYPEGTAGEAIPLGSRVLALADAYHAMASDRPHRPRRPHDEILKALRGQRGRQFDPTLTDVLVSVVSPLTPALSTCGREGESNG